MRYTLPQPVGIYRIYNKVTGKSYVGQSANVYNRIRRHMRYLKQQHASENKQMKRDYRLYPEGFRAEILELCPVVGMTNYDIYNWLKTNEQFYIEKYDSKRTGYNGVYTPPEWSRWKNRKVI